MRSSPPPSERGVTVATGAITAVGGWCATTSSTPQLGFTRRRRGVVCFDFAHAAERVDDKAPEQTQ